MQARNRLRSGLLLLVSLFTASATALGMPEIRRGELLLLATPQQYQAAPVLETAVAIEVNGVVARVTLQQRFRNATGDWVEAVYAFPLPEDAAVNRLRMQIGERVIDGTIAEREEAKKRYEQARSEGKKASLVQQHNPNLFRSRVANIAPGEEVLVELEYVEQVLWQNESYSLRFPMTMTPRYVPAGVDAGAASHPSVLAAQLPDSSSHKFRVSVDIDSGLPLAAVGARFHAMALTRSGYRYHLSLSEVQTALDRDLVLDWRPVLDEQPEAVLMTGQRNAADYGLLMLLPPAASASTTPVQQSREMIFVIDTSGSMGGSSIAQARSALQYALRNLGVPHTFNIIEFNNNARKLFPGAQPATRHNIERASEFVRHLEASGGTEMLSALELALPGRASESIRQVVFITDGAVANETELFSFISERLADSRLFTVGIGSAPNGWFMRKAAQFGRGSFTYIGDNREVESELATLFEQLQQPQLTDIKVQWPQGVEAYPQQLPDLYTGQPLQVLVRFEGPLQDGVVVVSGHSSAGSWQRQLTLSKTGDADDVATLWARRKIAVLLDQRVLGASDETVRAAVLPVALEHQLLSPYTSFIAVEKQVSRPGNAALGSRQVPNLVPHGQQSPLVWPATALGVQQRLLTSLLLLGLMSALWLMRGRSGLNACAPS